MKKISGAHLWQQATKIMDVNLILISGNINHVPGIQTVLHLWDEVDWLFVDMYGYRSRHNKGPGRFLTCPDDHPLPHQEKNILYYLRLIQTTLSFIKLSAYI